MVIANDANMTNNFHALEEAQSSDSRHEVIATKEQRRILSGMPLWVVCLPNSNSAGTLRTTQTRPNMNNAFVVWERVLKRSSSELGVHPSLSTSNDLSTAPAPSINAGVTPGCHFLHSGTTVLFGHTYETDKGPRRPVPLT